MKRLLPLVAGLFLLPFATAGHGPILTDAAGDVRAFTYVPVDALATPSVDLTRVDAHLDGDFLQVDLTVVDLSTYDAFDASGAVQLWYRFHFWVGDEFFTAYASYHMTVSEGAWVFQLESEEGGQYVVVPIDGSIDEGGSRVGLTIPLEAIGGSEISDYSAVGEFVLPMNLFDIAY